MAMIKLLRRGATRQMNVAPLNYTNRYSYTTPTTSILFNYRESEKGENNSKMITTSFISSPPSPSPPPLLLLRPQPLNRQISFVPNFQTKLPQALVAIRNQNNSNFRLIASAAGGDSEKIVVPRSVPVRVAHELLQAGHRYLDVRTAEEFSAGHAAGAVNVPYMFRAGAGMTKNPNFLEEVSKQFGKDAEIIVGCQSGRRSLMAAADLSFDGFSAVIDIAGGYAAWTQNGLPTQ